MAFRKLAERQVYRDEALGLRIDTVETPKGQVLSRKVVEYRKSAAVVPVLSDERVLLISHYRHPIGNELWDIPGGIIEPGEDPADSAARELQEETGYAAGKLTKIFRFHPEPAFTDHEIFLYRAEDLIRRERCHEEEIRDCRAFPRDDLTEMLASGAISSSWSVIGLLIHMADAGGQSPWRRRR